MPKVWLTTSRTHGFSAVEVLLAATVFAMLTTAVIGAFVYGRASTANSGDRIRANMLAEEGIEAVRNIRDAGFTNLIDGTYGIVQSGNTWTLSGSSDTNGIYTRRLTIASSDTDRKTITSTVNWPQGAGTSQTTVNTRLTNWLATIVKSWQTPILAGSVDASGAYAGYKITTNGDYAYLIRNSATGPNFFVINIAAPSAPAVVGSVTLSGSPTNVAVSGNYAYVSNTSDTQELQVVNVTNPALPGQVGSYNASGTGNGQGVYAVGSTVYLTRAANGGIDEFVIVNAATPSAPTRTGGYGLSVTMYEAYVNGTVAYVATSSDTQEILVINIATPSSLKLGTSVNLPGTASATTIDGSGSKLVVGQAAYLYAVTTSTPLVPVLGGNMLMPGNINDVSYDGTHNLAHVGTSYGSGEFQVIDVSNAASPTAYSNVDVPNVTPVTGLDYNAVKDTTPAALSSTTQEAAVFAPN